MKKTMVIALFAVTLFTVPACTTSSGKMASRQKITFTHRHSHNHRGMPKHHDGAYHNVSQVHEHEHTTR